MSQVNTGDYVEIIGSSADAEKRGYGIDHGVTRIWVLVDKHRAETLPPVVSLPQNEAKLIRRHRQAVNADICAFEPQNIRVWVWLLRMPIPIFE